MTATPHYGSNLTPKSGWELLNAVGRLLLNRGAGVSVDSALSQFSWELLLGRLVFTPQLCLGECTLGVIIGDS